MSQRQDPEDDLALSTVLIFSCHGTSLDLTECFEKDDLAGHVNAVSSHLPFFGIQSSNLQ